MCEQCQRLERELSLYDEDVRIFNKKIFDLKERLKEAEDLIDQASACSDGQYGWSGWRNQTEEYKKKWEGR